MSERERWIVYPLLFFALGAALRDKVAQQVEAKEIVCQRLRIVDQTDPTKILAEIGSQPSSDFFGPGTKTYLRVDDLRCERVNIFDRQDPDVLLAAIGSSATPTLTDKNEPRRSGFVQLRDNVDDGQVSEMRADQLLGNRLVTRQIMVLDPVNSRPLVYAGTEPTASVSLHGEEPAVSYQGVIYINNQRVGIRLSPPTKNSDPANVSPAKAE